MKTCPCCSNLMDDLKIKVWKCPSCSHIYRDIKISADYYASGKYRELHPLIEKEKRSVWINNISNTFGYIFEKIDSFLEVGSGDGDFCRHIRNVYSIAPESCELDPNLALSYYDWEYYIGDFTTLNISKKYDLIVALDVLEHIKNPIDFLNNLSSKYVLLQTPIDRKIKPPDQSNDSHYHYFSLKSISKLMEYKYKLIDYYHSGSDFSANGPELLTLFEQQNQ